MGAPTGGASLQNLNAVRAQGGWWLTMYRNNPLVNPDGAGKVPLGTLAIPLQGGKTPMQGYGWVMVIRAVSTVGDVERWVTNHLALTR